MPVLVGTRVPLARRRARVWGLFSQPSDGRQFCPERASGPRTRKTCYELMRDRHSAKQTRQSISRG
jgi:hypothetical protein